MNSVFRDITAGKIQTNVAKFTRQIMYNETKYTVKATQDILNFKKWIILQSITWAVPDRMLWVET